MLSVMMGIILFLLAGTSANEAMHDRVSTAYIYLGLYTATFTAWVWSL